MLAVTKFHRRVQERIRVLGWFDNTLKNGFCATKWKHLGNKHALEELVRHQTVEPVQVGRMTVGFVYKGHYLAIVRESKLNIEHLLNMGKI